MEPIKNGHLVPLLLLLVVCVCGCARKDEREEMWTPGAEQEALSEIDEDARSAPTETVVPDDAEMITDTVYVHVCGAVEREGVYRMHADDRVFDAIASAGGLTDEADGSAINQAGRLSDEMRIYVPTIGESEAGESIGAIAVDEEASFVNINQADEALLMTLSGIGQVKAKAIIAYREEYGPFTTVEDIVSVPGIGEALYMRIQDKITVG